MSKSRLIALTYFDPGKSVRLTVYADTIILDRNGEDSVISAVRFGGYPEMVKAMSDAIYGGATIEMPFNGKTRQLKKSDFSEFMEGYLHPERRTGERWSSFTREEIAKNPDDILDLGLIQDESALGYHDLPDPADSAEEAAAQLEEAVKLLRSVVKELRALEVRD